MGHDLPKEEREYLRELARKQARYAALPVMERRKRMWYDLNDGRAGAGGSDARPPVVIETWTFDRDFMPAGVLRCKSETGAGIEWELLRNVRNHELVNDDKVIPATFDIGWWVHIDEMGVRIDTDTVPDSQGVNTGYRYHHPIKDLEKDFHMLKPATCSVDREGTCGWKAFLEELLGDILPVRVRSGIHGGTMLTNKVIQLMGMEAYFTAMTEDPDSVHRFMAYLRDNALKVMRWTEAEGLLVPNNENEQSFGSSYNWTTKLPLSDWKGGPARLKDMWGCSNSQETVGVSPKMFHEFCFPYYRDVVEPMGLLYYGCCEPTHPYWEDLRKLPHLKKISISKWCDQKFMGEALKGTGIVFSRKPDPNMLATHKKLDEVRWAAHIRESLEAAPGIAKEFIIRDVYTVHGDLNNARRAVEVARNEIDRHEVR
jgi:hypothetical protein